MLIATRTIFIEMEESSLRHEIILLGCYLVTLLWISSCKLVNNNSESPVCHLFIWAATEESDLMRSVWGILLMPTKSQQTKRLIILFLNLGSPKCPVAGKHSRQKFLQDSTSGLC